MPRAVKSLLFTLVIFGITGVIVGISWYAATHPWFATHILLPIIGVAFFGAIWAFCDDELKYR